MIPLIVFFFAGVLFYVAGSATRRHRVQVPIAVEMGLAPPDGPPSPGPPTDASGRVSEPGNAAPGMGGGAGL